MTDHCPISKPQCNPHNLATAGMDETLLKFVRDNGSKLRTNDYGDPANPFLPLHRKRTPQENFERYSRQYQADGKRSKRPVESLLLLPQVKDAIANARKIMRKYGTTGLLASPQSNPKVAKNGKVDVLTAPMHLAPANLSGYEVCAMRTAGCSAVCLHTAGNPVYMAQKEISRIARTKFYFEARQAFLHVLIAEIALHVRKAREQGMECGVRLNATSDIPWERVPVVINGVRYANIMELFPNVQFYDYTKIAKRFTTGLLPANYHLTFSLAENNDAAALEVLRAGGNVAVVFDTKKNRPLPEQFMGADVIDGDVHDYRPVDGSGVVVGLRAKGDAIGDTSGFVRAA